MDPLNVLSVMLICVTVLIVAYWLFTKPITIKHIHRDEREVITPIKKPELTEAERKRLEQELNKSTIAQRSMDAVIKAANEMMGIEPLDEGGDNNDR